MPLLLWPSIWLVRYPLVFLTIHPESIINHTFSFWWIQLNLPWKVERLAYPRWMLCPCHGCSHLGLSEPGGYLVIGWLCLASPGGSVEDSDFPVTVATYADFWYLHIWYFWILDLPQCLYMFHILHILYILCMYIYIYTHTLYIV